MIKEAISKLIKKENLSREEAFSCMKEIMSGSATPSQIAAWLVSLRAKGESIEEIIGCAEGMLASARKIEPEVDGILVDTCGTGGDRIKTFNVSTAAALVISGAGIPVAKHGNRSVTSKCGSADLLERVGVKIDATPEKVRQCIEKIGIGFMFAPVFHPAMKHALPVRKEIGIRTIFNFLGPLTNPAGVKAQLMGVYEEKLTEMAAKVLKGLGCESAIVVHGMDGLDEISIIGKTKISELKNGEVSTYMVQPEDFGLRKADLKDILGMDIDESAMELLRLLHGKRGAKKDMLLMNSAAGIVLGGKADSFQEGVEIAHESISSGEAYEKLVNLVKESGGNLERLREVEKKKNA